MAAILHMDRRPESFDLESPFHAIIEVVIRATVKVRSSLTVISGMQMRLRVLLAAAGVGLLTASVGFAGAHEIKGEPNPTTITVSSWYFVPGQSDPLGASIVEYAPGIGGVVPVWDGDTLVMAPVKAPLRQATTDATTSPAAVGLNTTYDLYVWLRNGKLVMGRSLAWVGPQNRGAGAGSAERALRHGIPVNKYPIVNGPCARCGTWVATIRSDEHARIHAVVPWNEAVAEAVPDPLHLSIPNSYGPNYICCGRDYAGKVLRQRENRQLRVAGLLIFGQSMAGNNSPTRYTPKFADRIDNFDPYTGKLYAAADPLLGPSVDELSERKGNFALRLADKMMATGRWDRVEITNVAFGGSQIGWWADGNLSDRLPKTIQRLLDAKRPITAVTLAIGESDNQVGTDTESWVRSFRKVVSNARAAGLPLQVPWFVARETMLPGGYLSDAIRAAQAAVVDPADNIHAGPDIDALPEKFRMPHWNDEGSDASAVSWLDALQAYGTPFSGRPPVSAVPLQKRLR